TSDPGVSKDGIAIDDIHIFNLESHIYDEPSVNTLEQPVGTGWTPFALNGMIMGEVRGTGAAARMTVYPHKGNINPATLQYNLARNYVVQSETNSDSIGIRLYVTDAEVNEMVKDGSCAACQNVPDVYRLGITKYDDPDKSKENGQLSDNRGGSYSYIPYTAIRWVPYEKGYYAEFTVNSLSEFWFNTVVPTVIFPAGTIYPNPVVNGSFNLLWNAEPGTRLELAVFDMLGRKMHEAQLTATDYDNKTQVNLPPLVTGVYFLRYSIGGENYDAKILVR
ncbi:MAG: T9SS type A sorting domain-containing protein, partial [Sphingobacteriales bacterium]